MVDEFDTPLDSSGVDLRIMRILQAIENTGSITQASKELGLSQPAVSQAIQRAEMRLGMLLVLRSGRNAKLSEAGRVIYEAAGPTLRSVDEAVERLSAMTQLKSGVVRASSFPSVSATILPTLIRVMQTRAPGVRLKYSESFPEESLENLAEGAIDFAIVCSYPRLPLDPELIKNYGLEVIDLFTDPLYAILPKDHPLAGEELVEISDMEDDLWIAGSPGRRGFLEDACRAAGFSPNIAMETDDFVAAVGMVAMELGVTLLPRLTISTVALHEGVVARRTHEYRTLSLAVNVESLSMPSVRATIDALTAIDGSRWKLLRPNAFQN